MKNTGKVKCPVFSASLFAFLGLALFFAGESKGQTTQVYPDTFWVPVFFYDYHSMGPNNTNPRDTDFTFPGSLCIGSTKGMVDSSLSADRKPVPVTARSCRPNPTPVPCACHMVNWFRPSGTMGADGIHGYDTNCVFACDSGQANPLGGSRRGSSKSPVWYWAQKNGGTDLPLWQTRTGEYYAPGYDANNPYANVIIKDSLPFVSIKSGGKNTSVYQFVADLTTPKVAGSHFPRDSFGFFPIDGRGFGGPGIGVNEANFYGKTTRGHNFGYAMEMHTKFLYQRGQGLKFNFAGDDDVWCFINGKLAMDLGGVKGELADSITIDSIPGMISGKYYDFDLFYCERDPIQADIKITSNIVTAQPKNIFLSVPKYDTLRAGDTVKIMGSVLDQNGVNIPTKSNLIHWAEDTSQRTGDALLNPNGHLLPAYPNNQNDTVKFTATAALRSATVIANYVDATSNFACSTFVYIRPQVPDHIVIENSPSPQTVSPNSDNPLGGPSQSISMGSGQLYDTAYVVWRDKFQNYLSFDSTLTWSMSGDTTVVTIAPGNAHLGMGIIRKGSDTVGRTNLIIARDNPSGKSDTLAVTSIGRGYDSLLIVRLNPATGSYDQIGLTPLNIQEPDSITLFAEARRAGSTRWDILSVNWFESPNLTTTKGAPTEQSSWSVSPTDTGHGIIWITWPAPGGPRSDTIQAIFGFGAPTAIEICPKPDAPGAGNNPLLQAPAIADSVVAGVTDTLYAKLLVNGLSLPNTSPLMSQITWTVSPAARDTLLNATNYFGIFRSTRAWQNVTVTATWGSLPPCTILCRVFPGAINRLVIVGSSNIGDSGNVAELGQLNIASTDSLGYAYAVFRDAYSNFIGYAGSATWTSTNSALTTVTADTPAVGEGTIRKVSRALTGMDSVIANDAASNKRDTLPVNCPPYYYTSIQICNVQGTHLSSDTVQLGSTSTLYAFGIRSDGQPKELLPVTWSSAAGLALHPGAPADVNNWAFTADSVGNGMIKITRPGQGTIILADSVNCVFIPGGVSRLALYRQAGFPDPSMIFPATDSIVSETVDTIDAKAFDSSGLWLSQFEIAPADTAISWRIVPIAGGEVMGTDTVPTVRKGHITTFRPHRAWCLYKVSATFSRNGTLVTDSANIYVKPAAADYLVIEASSIIPDQTAGALLVGNHAISPPDTIRFGATDSVQYAYAVLRDKDSNFVSLCANTQWTPLNAVTGVIDSSIVTARPAFLGANPGQGQINRAPLATLGVAKVMAKNIANINQFNTVNVALEAYSYKQLRIVIFDSIPIDSIAMPSDSQAAFQVQAILTGGTGWVGGPAIRGNWVFLPDTGSSSQSASNVHEWDFTPGSAVNGRIIVTAGTAIPDTIKIRVLPGAPARVVIYDTMGPPTQTNQPLANPTTVINVIAGRPFNLAAKVVDRNGLYLADYDLATRDQYFHWSAVSPHGDSMNTLLAGRTGVQQYFTDTRSYDSAYVIVQFTLATNQVPRDTVFLRVLPDTASRMILEKSTAFDQHTPNPCDTLFIPKTSQTGTGSVYAVLRDRYNNAIALDTTITRLGVIPDTSVVGVRLNNPLIGEVLAYRNALSQGGTAQIFAFDAKGLADSCFVTVLPYGYQALRIVAGGDSVPPHSLHILNTNMDSTIYVQAQRDDGTLKWDPVSATWSVTPSLAGIVTPPAQPSQSFLMSPSDTGTGWIKVTLDTIRPDSLPVQFTAGGPVKVAIQILTPAAQRLAGQPIKALVILQDKHGDTVRIPSDTFNTALGGGAFYHDSRDAGTKPAPILIAASNPADPVRLDTTSSCTETFKNGVDTISFTLYNAPPDSAGNVLAHQIFVSLKTSGAAVALTGSSDAFKLYPGPITGLRMETQTGFPIHADTLYVNGTPQSDYYFARGYDTVGNLIGDMGSTWHVTDSLHDITTNKIGQADEFYSAAEVTRNEAGYLAAIYDTTYADGSVHAYGDSVHIVINGPGAKLDSVITGDWDGDGYLDHLELHFSRPVQLPSDTPSIASFAGSVTITPPDSSARLSVKSIMDSAKPADSVWTVTLNNVHPDSVLQTSWTPTVTLKDFSSPNIQGSSVVALDGAGPVIASVVKQKLSNVNNRQDRVTVTFSEPLRSLDADNALYAPPKIFDVWDNVSGQYVRDSTMLGGITTLKSPETSSGQAVFLMSNDSNLTLNQYFSIDSAIGLLTDDRGNAPRLINRKVRVGFGPSALGPMIVSPNPIRHPIALPKDSNLVIQDNANQVSNHGGGGTRMTFDAPVPNSNDTGIVVQASIAVYDILGNLVIANTNSRFIYFSGTGFMMDNGTASGEPVSGTVRPAVYWSGSNGRGMTVAPGVYRVVVRLHYAGSGKTSYSDKNGSANIGVTHSTK